MTDYYIQLTNIDFDGGGADPIEYHFKLISNLDNENNLPSSTIEAGDTNLNQNLSLNTKQINIPIEWILYDDGTDKSDGTLTSSNITDTRFSGGTIETFTEQKVWLEKYVFNNNLGAQWKLFGGEFTDPDGDGSNDGTNVTIETLNIRRSSGNPNSGRGVIQLKKGQRV